MAVLAAEDLAPGIRRALAAAGWNEGDGLREVGQAASGRTYWRAYLDHGSLVVQVNPPDHDDEPRFVDSSRAFREAGLPVARIHARDGQQMLLDDLGNQRLWDEIKQQGEETPFLPKAVILIRRLQAVAEPLIAAIPWLPERAFDREHLLWETAYFRDNCWLPRCQADAPRQSAFEAARLALADRVLSHPQTVVHRDYQTQNLMLDGERLAIIDHQGARIGSIFYDLASLAFDPYVELSGSRIRSLFKLYCSNHSLISDQTEAWKQFLDAAAQRVMQANGAYGFLTQRKGLVAFERWREPGWRQLQLLLGWHADAWGAATLADVVGSE